MKKIGVIGGGIGGLSAGIRLLQRGFEVTMVEKEPRPGGFGIAFSRGGYTFDLALHVVPSGGAGQEFDTMVRLLGLDIRFVRLAQGFNLYLGDYHFQMPNDYEALFQKLFLEFPHERRGLQSFRADLEKYVQCYAPLFDYRVSKFRSLPRFLPKIVRFLKHSSLSTAAYLGRFLEDERLKAILFQPAVFMGVPMREFATVNFMMMFYLLMKNGMYTIEGGGQRLTSELQRRFVAQGGHLMRGVAAEKIHISGTKAHGIALSTGESIDCDAIIAGNNLFDVVNTLIGRSHFSGRYLENLEKLEPSVSVLVLSLGLDCAPEKLGIDSHISMFFPDADIDGCFSRLNLERGVEGFSLTAHSVSEPGCGSGRHHAVSIVAGTTAAWLALEKERYRLEKEKTSRQIIERASRYFPGLKRHITVQDLATPKTMHRYTANPDGAIMGLCCKAGSHRNLIAAARLPITNIVMGSAWTNRLGGFMQSMKSGILAAEKI